MTHRSTVIVRVTTEDGPVGEAYAGDEGASLLEVVRIVSHEITPALTGSDAFAIERCWQLARLATFDILRDRRASLVACDLLWFEEPCRWDNDDRDLRDVRGIAGVPVCASGGALPQWRRFTACRWPTMRSRRSAPICLRHPARHLRRVLPPRPRRDLVEPR